MGTLIFLYTFLNPHNDELVMIKFYHVRPPPTPRITVCGKDKGSPKPYRCANTWSCLRYCSLAVLVNVTRTTEGVSFSRPASSPTVIPDLPWDHLSLFPKNLELRFEFREHANPATVRQPFLNVLRGCHSTREHAKNSRFDLISGSH